MATRIKQKRKLLLPKSKLFLFIVVFVIFGVIAVATSLAATFGEDLRSYYPNEQLVSQNKYLEGFNYISGTPQRAVLWFELLDNGKFKQYNYGPEDPKTRCHWDLLQWTSGKLVYSKTHDECGNPTKETVFSPAITLMPRTWNNNAWSANGKSSVSQIENNTIVCTGTNTWQANVIGREEIASGVQAIHVRSKQTIRWTSGRSSSGCAAGYTTNWQEDYYLLSNLPKDSGGTAKAMKRTIGGNKDVPSDRWDIWFDLWKTLPGK